MKFIRDRSTSLSMVVLVLFIIATLQQGISYTIAYGKLDSLISWMDHGLLPALGVFVRGMLVDVLRGIASQDVQTLLEDVVLLAVSNILIFSIWYWIIDPPGVDGKVRDDEPWDFLFPQRAQVLLHYESWVPRYTDYNYPAFTSSFAFSPTDSLPLTRRAKMLMLLQSTISLITLTAIASSAINIMVGGN